MFFLGLFGYAEHFFDGSHDDNIIKAEMNKNTAFIGLFFFVYAVVKMLRPCIISLKLFFLFPPLSDS